MIKETRKVLLNKNYGGFTLPIVIKEYLENEKGWIILVVKNESDFANDSLLLWMDLCGHCELVPGKGHEEEEIRFNEDVIEAVEMMQEKYKNEIDDMGYYGSKVDEELAKKLRGLDSIAVVNMIFEIDIESFDGREEMQARCYEEF